MFARSEFYSFVEKQFLFEGNTKNNVYLPYKTAALPYL